MLTLVNSSIKRIDELIATLLNLKFKINESGIKLKKNIKKIYLS